MKRNLNRRKLYFINKKKLFYFIFFILLLIFLFTLHLKKNFIYGFFINSIEIFSKTFQYEYINLSTTGIEKVEFNYLKKKLDKYSKYSIFLLPLNKISEEIKENNWIKNVKLSTNFKETLFIDIEEYKPIGIYAYNNKLFYFDNTGKIIDELNKNKKNNEDLIIFYGPSSNLEAQNILEILENLDFLKKYEVSKMEYVKKRRWNIYLTSNIKLMLSENYPIISIENFQNIEKNLSEIDTNNINYIDLRNINKTLVSYNE